jgi:hypothetical protein
MAIMTCESCQIVFEGRPNRRYCSIDCRRKAEMAKREIKRKEQYEAFLASLSPEEKAWSESIPKWDDLPSLDWDLPTVSWEGIPTAWGTEPKPTKPKPSGAGA